MERLLWGYGIKLEKTLDEPNLGPGFYINFTQEVYFDHNHIEVSLINSQIKLLGIEIYKIS